MGSGGGEIRHPEARKLDTLRRRDWAVKRNSQFEVDGWHQKIGESTLANAVCDRIVHDFYTIIISEEDSMRKRKGLTDEA